jgi:hypothetical protein
MESFVSFVPTRLYFIASRRGIGDLLAEGMYGVKKARPEWGRRKAYPSLPG